MPQRPTHRHPASREILYAMLTAILVTIFGLVAVSELGGHTPTHRDAEAMKGLTAQSTPDPPMPARVSSSEGPDARLESLDQAPGSSSEDEKTSVPDTFDPRNPPQWTEAMAMPSAHPAPPDPFTVPEMRVDPSQRSVPETARRRID